MPNPFHATQNQKATFYTTGQKKTGLIERIAVIGSATAIALFLVVDLVRSETPGAPLAAPNFRSASASGTIRPAAAQDEQWAADESAKGTRPDSSH